MKKNNKGFTLAELLIVVAIIAVLVAIAIPVFTTQLEKSREATDKSNVRSAYASVVSDYLAEPGTAKTMTVKAQQKTPGWQGEKGTITLQLNGTETQMSYAAKTSGSYTIQITASGTVSIN